MKLPPFDPGDVHDESGLAMYYTADQLHAYGLACAEAMRDECAKACDSKSWTNKNTFAMGPELNCVECAAAIRSIEVER